MNSEELALHAEYIALEEELAAAKASGDSARHEAAKRAIWEFRVYWRGIRDFFRPAAEEGVAAPETLTAKSAVTPL